MLGKACLKMKLHKVNTVNMIKLYICKRLQWYVLLWLFFFKPQLHFFKSNHIMALKQKQTKQKTPKRNQNEPPPKKKVRSPEGRALLCLLAVKP